MAVILIVEDDAFIREIAEDMIRGWGHQTLSASDVDEALLLLRSPQRIDALFTDIYLKTAVLGGCELAQEAIKLRPELLVLYTTGNFVSDKIKTLFIDGTHLLRKPYTQEQLQDSIVELLLPPDIVRAIPGTLIVIDGLANKEGAGDRLAVKQAEETLLKADALQSAIFNSANFSSIATDARGVIQIFNVGAERMLGYTAAEVMNKVTPADISDPQELIARAEALSVELGTPITPGFDALVFKASRGIEDIYELTYIRKDGSRLPAAVSVTALRDAQNAIIGYLLIGTDNTARKLAEEALLKAGALQNAIFNSANFSSIATDARGVIQIFNVGAERMLGYTAAEVMNRITPADISDPQELIARAKALSVELGTPITPGFDALVFKASRGIEDIYELTYIRKDGSRFGAVLSVTALRDAQNAIIGYLLIGTDNTARQQVEAERKKLELNLREANEELQRFTYIVSHDLRSPLVNIMGFASEIDVWQKEIFERLGMLRRQGGDGQNAEKDEALRVDVEEALGFIKSSVAKMDRLIGALLKLSREGQRQFQPQFVDMTQLMHSTLEALAHQAKAVNAKVSIGDLPTISSDRLALEQVFSNLIDNAIKYLKAGVPGSIDVQGTESDRAVTYEVSDNGRGIDARDRERIFDLFRRSGIQDRPGDGIGLAHARTLVRGLGGSIKVESEPGRGTVFKVTLPKKWPLPISEVAA